MGKVVAMNEPRDTALRMARRIEGVLQRHDRSKGDWADLHWLEAWAKLSEEIDEVVAECDGADTILSSRQKDRILSELGDMCASACILADVIEGIKGEHRGRKVEPTKSFIASTSKREVAIDTGAIDSVIDLASAFAGAIADGIGEITSGDCGSFDGGGGDYGGGGASGDW
jgi:uncharacterized membrane protein YgcG